MDRVCNICDKTFTKKHNLYKHQRLVHKIETRTGGQKCHFDSCQETYRTLADLRSHLARAHKAVNFSRSTKTTFLTVEDFMVWKRQEEINTNSHFVTRRTPLTVARTGSKKQIYYCHRSGQYIPKGKGKRHLKSQGSCKIGKYCLAAMDAEFNSNGTVSVIYWSEHCGHNKDLEHTRVTDAERGELGDVILPDPQKYDGSLRCPEKNCPFKCSLLTELRSHLNTYHGVQLEEMKLTFPSMTEFTKWKEEEEKSSKSLFIAGTPMKKLQDGSNRMYLNCHRSATCKTRNLRAQGSWKVSRCCPASMRVEENYGIVTVDYYKTHYGHDIDYGAITHLRLTQSERALIAEKIEQGMPFECILDDLQSSSHGKFNRFHLLTKKDLYNIQRSVKRLEKPASKESETLENWLEKSLSLGQQSPILYCKDRGVNEEFNEAMEGPVLEANDFLLVLSNPLQREMLLRFGSNAICLDYLDVGPTQELALTTVVVIDEFDEPFPVAFCLSNRVDITAFQRFFAALFERVGNITTSRLISDDHPALYGAWAQMMGEYEHHFLCPWYTEKCWKGLIEKIPKAKKAKRSTVYRWMKTLMEISEKEWFTKELSSFLEEMMQDEDTGMFLSHFKDQFALRPEMWAHCFLGPKWTGVLSNLEIMHRSLFTAFCHGKDFGHVVRCLKSLNKLVRDSNCTRIANKTAVANETGQPQTDGEVPFSSILVEVMDEDNTWRVQDECGETHQVQKISDHCQASECAQKTCVHNYSCTCMDFVAYTNFCQHLDTVSQLQQISESPIKEPPAPAAAVPIAEQPVNETKLVNSVEQKVGNLLGFLKEGKFGTAALTQMERQIDAWIDSLKSTNQMSTQIVTEAVVKPIVIGNINNSNDNIVLLLPVGPPNMNAKLPISRYRSPLGDKVPISRSPQKRSKNKTHVRPLVKSNNKRSNVEVHSGFDHVY